MTIDDLAARFLTEMPDGVVVADADGVIWRRSGTQYRLDVMLSSTTLVAVLKQFRVCKLRISTMIKNAGSPTVA